MSIHLTLKSSTDNGKTWEWNLHQQFEKTRD